MTNRPYGEATRHVIAYLRTHGEGTARQIADAGEWLRSAHNVTLLLERHDELFEEVGEAQDGRSVWGLVKR